MKRGAVPTTLWWARCTFARLLSHCHHKQPGEAQEHAAVYAQRVCLREAGEVVGEIGVFLVWGEAGEMAAFEAQERARWNRAASMLRNGVGEGNVAIACQLTVDEIEGIRAQLEGRTAEQD